MELITTTGALRERLRQERRAGRSIGVVPTMGALHEGHLSLVDAARHEADFVVMTIFVNPLQFRPGEDLARYPRNLERDMELAAGRGVDLVFAPSVEEMYADGTETRVVAGDTAIRWEGAARPGHFDGVLTVVAKLFNIVQPDLACFGRKDVQQATLIAAMVQDLDFPVRIVVVPTVRDSDGLALSSRNAYLSAEERRAALAIPRSLEAARTAWRSGERRGDLIRSAVATVLDGEPSLVTDYIAVVSPRRMEQVETVEGSTVIAVAVRAGSTRLIDNITLEEGSS
ncbi:MAG TPA: pantoate--beta-alanine ligase [Gemmatimonadales bacterium]|nr:pantoate--beta-alanine ligase [Gemmatimonadales bacterium]